MFSFLKPGLRFKLTAAFIALSALTVISLAYFTIQHSYQALKSQKQQDELVIAKNISAQIDEVLGKAKATITTLSRHRDISNPGSFRQSEALDIVTQVTELIDGIAVLDSNGKVLAIDRTAPDTEGLLPPPGDIKKLFVHPAKENPAAQFTSIFLSRSGEIVAGIIAPVVKSGSDSRIIVGLMILKNHTMGGIEPSRLTGDSREE
ncbi:MAG: hypothetical protein Q7R35_07485 [Elusimicrobiota bacterium]|nr:hypothetical protein [Elusimicrobiota bacterium]